MVRTGIIIADETTLIGDDAGGGVIFHLSALFQSGLQKTATQVIMMTSEKHPAPPETQGSGISNFTKSVQSAEMYYPLDIATKLVQKYYPGVDLLSYANAAINIDKICLLVDATKDDVEVITVDRHENSVLPVLTHAPDMFVLGIRESKSVELRGNDSQCDFTRGYTFSSGQPVETHPYDNAQPAELQYATNNWVWRIINKVSKQTHIVELARDCLFVLHLELAKQFPLIETESQPESTLLVETLKVEIPDLKGPVVALATHQISQDLTVEPVAALITDEVVVMNTAAVTALPTVQITQDLVTDPVAVLTTSPATTLATAQVTEISQAAMDWYQRIENTDYAKLLLIQPEVLPPRSYYKYNEAVEFAKSNYPDLPHFDLLNYATQNKISLLTGVPDNVELSVYDDETKKTSPAFLMKPQLLALLQTYCVSVELNGKTEQSDFKVGYIVDSSGQLQQLLPDFGYPKLNHQWVYWRAYQGDSVKKLELIPERLFVTYAELINLPMKVKLVTSPAEPLKSDQHQVDAALYVEKQTENQSTNHGAPTTVTPIPAAKDETDSKAQAIQSVLVNDELGKAENAVEGTPATMNNASIDVQTTSRGNAEDDLDTAVNALKSKPQEFAALVIQPKHNHAKETKEVRVARLRLRKAVLIQQGVKNFLEVLSEEEGYKGTSRIKQLLAPPDNQPKKQSSKSVKKTNDWDY